MAEIVGAALTAHAPLITGKPEVSRPEQRDRLYAGFREAGRRLQATRPDLLVMFVNDHLQNFAYDNMPAFCIGLAGSYEAPSDGGAAFMRIPARTLRGTPEPGRINPASALRGLDDVARGDIEPLTRLSWEEIERDGGHGGQEIRNWIALLGAVPGWKGDVLAYEGVAEWITGCATVWVHP